MELWITTQDNECLMKIDRLDYDYASSEHRIVANGFQTLIGKYKSRERALEILKEISNRITNKYIVKANCLIKPSGPTLKRRSTPSKVSLIELGFFNPQK